VRCILLCSLVLLISLVPGALAQIPLENAESHFLAPLTKISKVVNEVDLAFTVTDKKGRFISNLQPSDFALLDNNTAPDRLTFFQQRSDLPLHLAILIDASDSVRFRFKFERDAAHAFVKRVMRARTDEVFVVTFNDQVKTVQELSEKKANISKALKATNVRGDTALYDAIIYASEKLRQIPEHQLTRRGVVLLSDGVDTVHRSTLEQAKEAAARAGVMVFSVSTNFLQDDSNEAGDRTLKDLAESTGGMFLSGGDEDKIRDAFRDVEKALRHQYVVAYNPASFSADGSYHTVEVVPRKHGLRANCRKGYYAIVRAFH
jgi:Ca-activated chloride channel family protein